MTKKTKVTTITTTVTTEEIKDVKPTQIVVVLDRSGSMDTISQATVDGINSFIKEQKSTEDEAFMTLTQFDNQYEVTYSKKPIKEVDYLINGVTFIPRATTALYDAIGRTINELQTTDDVVFVIVTDGIENASSEFTRERVFEKIEEKKKLGWKFLFLGANQDAMATGNSLGISSNNSISYNTNTQSVNTLFSMVSNKMSSYRSSKSYGNVNTDSLDFTDNDRKEINK